MLVVSSRLAYNYSLRPLHTHPRCPGLARPILFVPLLFLSTRSPPLSASARAGGTAATTSTASRSRYIAPTPRRAAPRDAWCASACLSRSLLLSYAEERLALRCGGRRTGTGSRLPFPPRQAQGQRAMAALPRAAPPTPAALLPLPRSAPPLLLAGRAAAARRSRLRARGPSAAARRSWVVASSSASSRAVLGGVARREAPAAPQKPTQQVRMDMRARSGMG